MKSPKFRPVHKRREITTNAERDNHQEFCKRCFARNGTKYCPKKDLRECSI